jgi:predicted ArsR family transcriptional regulator
MPTITDLNQVTPELLREMEQEREEQNLRRLIRDNVMQLGRQYRQAYSEAFNLEVRCKLRARQLHDYGFEPKELQELFGVEKRVINRWLK